jgi:pimeloyl-ACP methyl ester carboxylesterase
MEGIVGEILNPRHEFLNTNNIRLHCAIQGEGPLMVFLHGFPEFWYCWRHQIPVFAEKFRAVAPDMRGYNRSDKPEGVDQYRMGVLVEDIRGLIGALGEEKIFLVAHDWGGAVAWAFAERYPDMLHKLVILNAPHHHIFARELRDNPVQQKASEYMLLLRSSRAEEILSRDGYAWLKTAVFDGCKDPSAFTDEDRAVYVEAWSMPGALTGSVNYYRAAGGLTEPKIEGVDRIIRVPTLVLWGEEDIALTLSLLDGLEDYVPDLKIMKIPGATHWVQNDVPYLVNRYIWDFVGKIFQV